MIESDKRIKKGKMNQKSQNSVVSVIAFQMYIWVRVAIFSPIDSIIKTLFMAFFNGAFSALDLSLSTSYLYYFTYPKHVLLIVFMYFRFFMANIYFYFFSSFFSLIDSPKVELIVFAILKFVSVPLYPVQYLEPFKEENLQLSKFLLKSVVVQLFKGMLNWFLLKILEFLWTKSLYSVNWPIVLYIFQPFLQKNAPNYCDCSFFFDNSNFGTSYSLSRFCITFKYLTFQVQLTKIGASFMYEDIFDKFLQL